MKQSTLDATFFDFEEFSDVKISLLGAYQPINATNVLTAVKILREQGISIKDESVYKGLESSKWLARFEVLCRDPVVIFDGAHNPQGVDSCVESVKAYFGKQRVIAVSGVMADKNYHYIADKIGEIASDVMCVAPENPRALASSEYANEFLRQNINAIPFNTVGEAVSAAVSRARDKKQAVVCLGSLYMYSQVEAEIKKTNIPLS